MNQGYFFQLEKNSKQAKGAVIFRYLRIKVSNASDTKKYSVPEYPVYLIIKSFAIDFYFHGISYSNGNTDHERKKKANEEHVNIRLLHLPLSQNIAVKDNLTSILINCYELEYNINPIYQTQSGRSSDTDIICYSNLEVFNSEIEENPHKSHISFKRLFLDFLFDLEHSKVFENSPHYEEAEIHLVENLFFHYLANKAAFHYEWEQYLIKKNSREQMGHVYSLKEKEKEWLENCLDSRSPVMFEESEGWFEPVEDEMKQILFRKKRRDWVKQLIEAAKIQNTGESNIPNDKNKIKKFKTDDSKLLIKSSKWFLRRYNFDDAISSLLLLFSNRSLLTFSLIFLVIPFILLLYVQKGFFYESIFMKLLILLSLPAILFGLKLLSRYKNKKINYKTITFRIPPFTSLNAIGWITFILLFDFIFWGNLKSFPESIDRYLVFILVGFIFLFLALHIFVVVKGIYLAIVSIFLPRLIIGLFGAWFFILTTEELVLANFDRLLGWDDIFLLILLAFIILIFIMIQIKTINKADLAYSYWHHAFKLIERSVAFLFFSFFVSLVIGQLSTNIFVKKTILNSGNLERYIKEISIEQFDETIKPLVKGLQNDALKVPKDICSEQLFNLLRNVYGKKDKIVNSNKILFITSLSLPFSTNKFSLVIFPRMLIFLAVFALFFGVFIQLIFEDKPVTEPL